MKEQATIKIISVLVISTFFQCCGGAVTKSPNASSDMKDTLVDLPTDDADFELTGSQQGPCWPLANSCSKLGYVVGGPAPRRLWLDCVKQAVSGQKTLPNVNSDVISNCVSRNSLVKRLQKSATITSLPSGLRGLDQWDVIDGETNLGIVRDWPIPSNIHNLPDYLTLARNYESATFQKFDERTHRWRNGQSPYFTSLSIQQPSFLLHNNFKSDQNSSESMVVFPGILSSSLIGSDMTKFDAEIDASPRGTQKFNANLVRMMKAYYHADPVKTSNGLENGLFTDHFVNTTGSGGSFWYELVPNVYAMQVQSLYDANQIEQGRSPNEPTFDDLTHRMADTLERMVQFLKGKNARLPSFDYSGVRLISGGFKAWDPHCHDGRNDGVNLNLKSDQVVCPATAALDIVSRYEPDAAGSIALIGLMAFDRWKDSKYLNMAEDAIQFLSEYDRNPVYEVEFNFAVVAAARLNRTYAKNHDIKKFMQWAFSRSNSSHPDFKTNARPDVGIIAEKWGRFPMYGMWGGKAPYAAMGGYAFYMNTISQAVTLAPIAKYYPQYSTLMGKYLLNVASNARVFFPDEIPELNQHSKSLARLKLLTSETGNQNYKSIPYEGFRKDPVAGGGLGMARGDAVDWVDAKKNPAPWAETNQSFYSGALTGMFASILTTTNSPEIPAWNLNRTDFQAPKSHPTFLLYNPKNERQIVMIEHSKIRNSAPQVGKLSYWIYNSVNHQCITDTDGGLGVSLDPGQSGIFSIIPKSHKISVVKNSNSGTNQLVAIDSDGLKSVLDYDFPAQNQTLAFDGCGSEN